MNKFANDNRAANELAASMDAIMRDEKHQKMFSTSSILEKLAFKRVADENKPSEIEVEITNALSKHEDTSLEATAGDERADCVCCGKKRANWNESMGVCKCSSKGCSPVDGCKDDCDCGCSTKKAAVTSDSLVKSACDALLKVSADLDDAGFEQLSARALIFASNLVAEAKAKKTKKDPEKAAKDKEKFLKMKEKEKADKEKSKLKAEKDKNAAKDKAMKEKAREKALADKAKAEKEKAKK